MVRLHVLDIDPMLAEIAKTACDYFHNRLISPSHQASLQVDFGLINNPTRLDASIMLDMPDADALSEMQNRKPQPRQEFKLIMTRKSRLEDTILAIAKHWVHIASLSTGRLMLTRKTPKVAICAWWLGEHLGPINAIPTDLRPWRKDQEKIGPLLADEYANLFMGDLS
jgi:hypothetical protein